MVDLPARWGKLLFTYVWHTFVRCTSFLALWESSWSPLLMSHQNLSRWRWSLWAPRILGAGFRSKTPFTVSRGVITENMGSWTWRCKCRLGFWNAFAGTWVSERVDQGEYINRLGLILMDLLLGIKRRPFIHVFPGASPWSITQQVSKFQGKERNERKPWDLPYVLMKSCFLNPKAYKSCWV